MNAKNHYDQHLGNFYSWMLGVFDEKQKEQEDFFLRNGIKSEDELNSWFQPVFEKYIQKTKGLLAGFTYDVNVYFIPMFTGVNAAATGTAKRKALKNIDPQLLPYVLFYKGELKPYKEALEFDKKDVPYFFVLDPTGKIVHTTIGKYTEDKMDEIEGVIE